VGWFSAPDYWLSRLVFERALGVIYLIAFVVARNQFAALIGEHGLLPVPRYIASVTFRHSPSLFHWRYSDRMFRVVTATGAAASGAIVIGLVDQAPLWGAMLVWALLWALYLSIVNVGQLWYGFGWESLLLETGFLAVFLGPSHSAPPTLVLWLLRWLLFRVEFGAGLIKIRGDACWRNLTCLYYHHETQPMPNPLSWYFHHLPKPLHKIEVAANHVAQLAVPFALFMPQPVAGIGAAVILATQSWLVLSGNFSWLNAVTIALAIPALGDSLLRHVVHLSSPHLAGPPGWYEVVVLGLFVAVVVMSWWPARNLFSRRQLMNFSFNRLHLVNTYGAFGGITRTRHEIVVEGTDEIADATVWGEYDFTGKPGDPNRQPPQIAPYHLRLDWLMWFAALSRRYAEPWFMTFLGKLLDGDRATLKLLRTNPFPEAPPMFVRARLYRYQFTDRRERRSTGAWWRRTLVGEFVPPIARRGHVHPRGDAR